MLGPIIQLWSQLYQKQTFEKITIDQSQLNSSDPVEAFVYMEIETVIEILQIVDESITTLQKILAGTEMLSAQSQKEATDLLKGMVPPSWETRWEGPENPQQWIRIVNKKAIALIRWMQAAQAKTLLEKPLNLSDLFHPETFLNALRQRSARRLKIAIDELKLVSSFDGSKISR